MAADFPFEPLFRHPHLQTILGYLWPRDGAERRFPLERQFYRTEPQVQVLVESQRPAANPSGHIVMVHGLEGSGQSGYVRGLSRAGLDAGFAVHRFHLRTCGRTERLCPTLYHAGLTSDLVSVLRQLEAEARAPMFLVGFSLGGNVALKLAGELGIEALPLLRGVCAVSTPLDLGACARRIAQRENWIYERRLVGHMRRRLRATGRYGRAALSGLRSIADVDEHITAPSFGFGSAANYYQTQSAARYLAGIRVRALVIQAKDDPMVPFDSCQPEALGRNPHIEHWVTQHGGHLGFLGRKPHRFWVEDAILTWMLRVLGGERPANFKPKA